MKSTLALLSLAVLLGACNATPAPTQQASPSAPTSPAPSIAATPSIAPTPTPTLAPTPTPQPTASAPDPSVAVVRIEQTGGMMPPWETLRWLPSIALYADGRLIQQGPQIDIFPGPALPNLQVTHLTQHGVDQILAWAMEASLQGEDRFLGPQILDAGHTLFTITYADGTTHRTSITDMTNSDPAIGAASRFQEIMVAAREWVADDVLGNDQPYRFDRLRLISFEADPQTASDPMSSVVEWPLDEPLATIGQEISEPYRCSALTGDELAQMLPLFEQANQLTIWSSDDRLYQINLRPLLPDEEECPGI